MSWSTPIASSRARPSTTPEPCITQPPTPPTILAGGTSLCALGRRTSVTTCAPLDVWTETNSPHWLKSYDVPTRDLGWLVLENAGVRQPERRTLSPRAERAPQPARRHSGIRRAIRRDAIARSARNARSSSLGDRLAKEREQQAHYRRIRIPAVHRHRPRIPQRARTLLAESGWRVEDGVLVNRAGEHFEIEFLSVDTLDQRTVLP